jgi:hypothetical protein
MSALGQEQTLPLRGERRHNGPLAICPAFSHKRTSFGTIGISASATPEISGNGSLDQLVGADKDGRWEGQAERFCHPGIDNQFVACGLFNRNVSGLCAF